MINRRNKRKYNTRKTNSKEEEEEEEEEEEKEKEKEKFLALSLPRKDPNPNQEKYGLQIYQQLPSDVPPFSFGIISLRNKANNDNPETTYTSHTDKDDTSHTN